MASPDPDRRLRREQLRHRMGHPAQRLQLFVAWHRVPEHL